MSTDLTRRGHLCPSSRQTPQVCFLHQVNPPGSSASHDTQSGAATWLLGLSLLPSLHLGNEFADEATVWVLCWLMLGTWPAFPSGSLCLALVATIGLSWAAWSWERGSPQGLGQEVPCPDVCVQHGDPAPCSACLLLGGRVRSTGAACTVGLRESLVT